MAECIKICFCVLPCRLQLRVYMLSQHTGVHTRNKARHHILSIEKHLIWNENSGNTYKLKFSGKEITQPLNPFIEKSWNNQTTAKVKVFINMILQSLSHAIELGGCLWWLCVEELQIMLSTLNLKLHRVFKKPHHFCAIIYNIIGKSKPEWFASIIDLQPDFYSRLWLVIRIID